ncbi:transcription factor related protein [Cyclospora cayetanensis]|uniref:Transcription factor related protein n=1 Tax=Cyclospora cayetanensis TaxID=88456 RepID=A0A1D3CYY0_9EIME|nr:transcription factor related protein [Cyclospora cayetanensis]
MAIPEAGGLFGVEEGVNDDKIHEEEALDSRDERFRLSQEQNVQRKGGGSNSGGGDGGDAEDETLGGFIERDEEAAIHEDPDDIVPVEGGIESDREVDWTDPAPSADPTSFEGALDRLRQRRKRRPKPLDSDLQLFCNQMLQKMSEASQQDERSLEAGEPATAKLQMLDSVCTELVKVLAGWLAPFRDDTLPNFSLRRRLLEVLGHLPITAQDLASNDLGKVLVLLWQHDDETESNRQLIRGLIQKWMRPVLGLGSSHRQLLFERERAFEANDSDLQQKLVKAAQAARQLSEKAEGIRLRVFAPDRPAFPLTPSLCLVLSSLCSLAERATEQTAEKRRRTARVPVNRGHNFIIQPRSQVEFNEEEGKQQQVSQVGTHFCVSLLLLLAQLHRYKQLFGPD